MGHGIAAPEYSFGRLNADHLNDAIGRAMALRKVCYLRALSTSPIVPLPEVVNLPVACGFRAHREAYERETIVASQPKAGARRTEGQPLPEYHKLPIGVTIGDIRNEKPHRH